MDSNEIHRRFMALWSIQESLLQSYRAMFLTSQAILLSISVAVALGPSWRLSVLSSLFALFLLYCGRKICRNRGYDVWFCQLSLLRLEDGETVSGNVAVEFKKWQGLPVDDKRKQLSDYPRGKELIESPTRKRMERDIPITLFICWVILLAIWSVRNLLWLCHKIQ